MWQRRYLYTNRQPAIMAHKIRWPTRRYILCWTAGVQPVVSTRCPCRVEQQLLISTWQHYHGGTAVLETRGLSWRLYPAAASPLYTRPHLFSPARTIEWADVKEVDACCICLMYSLDGCLRIRLLQSQPHSS